MAKFALLLPHAPDRYVGLSEDDYMAVIKDYVAWVEQATEDGVYAGGHKLTDDPGKTVSRNGAGVEVHESPFAEVSEILGGLMIIEAADLDAAVEISRNHPHLKHNSKIEIRQVHEV